MPVDLDAPTRHLARVSALYPKFWTHLEEFRARSARGKMPSWPGWCYCPMAGAGAIISAASGGGPVPSAKLHGMSELAALGAWRPGKGIYVFDNDLASALSRTPISGTIPANVLQRLPEWCVYIVTDYDPRQAFFAWLEYDVTRDLSELRMLLDAGADKLLPLTMVIGGTVAEGVETVIASSEAEARKQGIFESLRDVSMLMGELINRLLPLVLYLCSDEPDYAGPSKPSRPTPTRRGRIVGAQAPRVWLRTARDAPQGREHHGGTHASPRPHLRAAHWHTYWTGKRSDPIPRLRFIYPIMVGNADGTVPTVHEVTKEGP
jgi:hypothetical protein